MEGDAQVRLWVAAFVGGGSAMSWKSLFVLAAALAITPIEPAEAQFTIRPRGFGGTARRVFRQSQSQQKKLTKSQVEAAKKQAEQERAAAGAKAKRDLEKRHGDG